MKNKVKNFYHAIAKADDVQSSCDELVKLVDDTVGTKLMTLMILDEDAGLARRIYSNMPDAYPVSGTKPMEKNPWSEKVLGRRETFVANTIEAIDDVFPDAALIKSLGCESVINIPIEINGKVLGSMNILHEAGHYTNERVEISEHLKLPASLCFLMLKLQALEV